LKTQHHRQTTGFISEAAAIRTAGKLYLFSHQTCYLYLLSDVLPDFHCRSRPSAGRAKIDEEESEPEKSRTLCKMVLEAKHF